MTKATILGRAFVFDTGDPTQISTWEHKFDPIGSGQISGAEWAKIHLEGSYDDEDLRELLGVPKEGNFQVLFKGTISGWKSFNGECDEYDEEFDVEEFEFEKISDEYLHYFTNTLPEPKDDITGGTSGHSFS